MNTHELNATRDLDALRSLTQAMVASQDPKALLSEISSTLAGRIDFDRASILLLDPSQTSAKVITATDLDDDERVLRLQVVNYPELRRLIDTRATVVIVDTSIEPDFAALPSHPTLAGGSALLFPLLFEGALIGAVFLRRARGKVNPSPDALRFGEIVAGLCATALHMTQALEEAQRAQAVANRAQLLAESKLKDSERFEEFFEYAAEGMAVLDVCGRFLSVNREGAKLLGYEPRDLIGNGLGSFATPAERGRVERMVRGFSMQIYPRKMAVRVRQMRGSERIISFSAGGLGGGAEGVILSFRDVTTELQTQRELTATKTFLENLVTYTVDAIIAARMDGKIILFNETAERILGYPSGEDIAGVSLESLAPEGEMERLIARLGLTEGRLEPLHATLLARTGEQVPVRASASMLYEEGEPVARVFLFHDLRKELQLQADIDHGRSTRMELEGALLLASTAAHELNQPLTTVIGFGEMAVAMLEEGHRAHRPLGKVMDSAERLAQKVRELGKLKRIVTRSYGDGSQIVDLKASTATTLPNNLPVEERGEPTSPGVCVDEDL